MSEALSELTELEVLDLSGNELGSRVPSALTEIAGLRILDLSDNRLRGAGGLAWLGEFETLEELDLSQNRIEAPIPAALGAVSSLTRLDLSQNRWTGGCDSLKWERQANWCLGRRWKSSAAKEQAIPCRSASRARVIARWPVKRR